MELNNIKISYYLKMLLEATDQTYISPKTYVFIDGDWSRFIPVIPNELSFDRFFASRYDKDCFRLFDEAKRFKKRFGNYYIYLRIKSAEDIEIYCDKKLYPRNCLLFSNQPLTHYYDFCCMVEKTLIEHYFGQTIEKIADRLSGEMKDATAKQTVYTITFQEKQHIIQTPSLSIAVFATTIYIKYILQTEGEYSICYDSKVLTFRTNE